METPFGGAVAHEQTPSEADRRQVLWYESATESDRVAAERWLQAIGSSLQQLGQLYPSLAAYLQERQRSPVHSWNAFWEAYYRYDAEVHPDGTVTSLVPKAAI